MMSQATGPSRGKSDRPMECRRDTEGQMIKKIGK